MDTQKIMAMNPTFSSIPSQFATQRVHDLEVGSHFHGNICKPQGTDLHLPCNACMKHVELLKSGKDLIWWHPLTSRSIMQLPTRSSCKLKTRVLVLGLPSREHQFLPSAPNIYKKGTWRAGSTHGGVICQQGNVTDQTCLSAWDLKANLW